VGSPLANLAKHTRFDKDAKMALRISRREYSMLRPNCLGPGRSGSMICHSRSLRFILYVFLFIIAASLPKQSFGGEESNEPNTSAQTKTDDHPCEWSAKRGQRCMYRYRSCQAGEALAPLCYKQTLRIVLEGRFVVIQPVLELQTQ
jgi:hypothetical protein